MSQEEDSVETVKPDTVKLPANVQFSCIERYCSNQP